MTKTTIPRRRYKAVSTGYWSYIVDRTTGAIVSHGYDLMCDAEHYAHEKNKEWRRSMYANAKRGAVDAST